MFLEKCDQTTSEQDFAAHVQTLVGGGDGPCVHASTDSASQALVPARVRAELVTLLRESHPVYRERGAAAIVRMRGWVLLALERVGVTDDELVYVLEELDNGHDPYLVAAAARALRSYPTPQSSFIPVVRQALATIRYSDEAITLQRYSGYAFSASVTSAARELRATQRWLKASAPPRHACCSAQSADTVDDPGTATHHPAPSMRERATSDAAVPVQAVFEDQDRSRVEFGQFFRDKPSVVVFFYTRCNNPQKCSLTIAKLGRLQHLLRVRGLSQRLRTAAITYDPAFDLPHRLRSYAHDRGVKFDADHRVLRATEHWDELRAHFDLGVNFVGSIVNRHRIELFVLDAQGRVAASFERLQWKEEEVLAAATKLLPKPKDHGDSDPPPAGPSRGDDAAGKPGPRSYTSMHTESLTPATGAAQSLRPAAGGSVSWASMGTVASVAAAFFPKCAMCWTAYLSIFGIAGLERIPYAPWLLPIFIALMIVNVASLWPGQNGNVAAFALAVAGAQVILVLGIGCEVPGAAPLGLALSTAGSFLSVKSRFVRQRHEREMQLAFAQATTTGLRR